MSWGTIEGDGRVSAHEVFEAPYCSMVHDFAVTTTHVVFPVLPLTGDLDRARSGRPPFAWDPAQSGFLGVMHRDHGVASLAWAPVGPCFAFHVMKAFDGEGSLLTVVWRPGRGSSSLLVFVAQALEQGPVAEVALARRVPFGFHGSWVPA